MYILQNECEIQCFSNKHNALYHVAMNTEHVGLNEYKIQCSIYLIVWNAHQERHTSKIVPKYYKTREHKQIRIMQTKLMQRTHQGHRTRKIECTVQREQHTQNTVLVQSEHSDKVSHALFCEEVRFKIRFMSHANKILTFPAFHTSLQSIYQTYFINIHTYILYIQTSIKLLYSTYVGPNVNSYIKIDLKNLCTLDNI